MDRQDINYGVDFERAREHLDAEAGRLFRTYLAAKKSGGGKSAAPAKPPAAAKAKSKKAKEA